MVRTRYVFFLTYLFTTLQALLRYFNIVLGSATPAYDARVVWLPVARAVLEGTPLYLIPAVDNKPPLLHFLNIVLATSDHYYLLFLLIIAMANASVATGLFIFLKKHDTQLTGFIAAGLFLTALPLIAGIEINPRSLGMVGLMGALLFRSPWLAGTSYASGLLMTQYVGLLLLPVIYHRIRDLPQPSTELVRFAGGAALVIIAAFGFVGVYWSLESLISGLYWSFGVAGDYVVGHQVEGGPGSGNASLFIDVPLWGWYGLRFGAQIWFVILPSVVLIAQMAAEFDWDEITFLHDLGLMAILGSITLLVRSYPTYWLVPLPFLAALSAVQIRRWFV